MDHHPSPLFRLPPELRDHIYHLTFTTSYATTLATNRIQHPLTRTSRLLRHETLPLFLSLTRFNAHLDDGPADPLAAWLRALGRERCLLLREVNIWDLHMLNGSLHGVRATERMLKTGRSSDLDGTDFQFNPDDEPAIDDREPASPRRRKRNPYILQPVGRDVFHGSWYLADLLLTLQTLGLRLQRFCEVLDASPSTKQLKQTSHFAIQRFDFDADDDACGLAGQFGLDGRERGELLRALEAGERVVRLQEGRRTIVLVFDGETRLVGMRQQFIPREEEFYLG